MIPLLLLRQLRIRTLSRSKKNIVDKVENINGNLLKKEDVDAAVAGSDTVYLLAGLTYNSRIWEQEWPVIMNHTIEACKKHNAKLIFFDNVYMYGHVKGIMTEDTPFSPVSKKGEIRAKIAGKLLAEMKAGNITALIARSADFYGPYASKTSVINMLMISNLLTGKNANWIGNANKKHSLTYTLDAARALVLLSNDENSFLQTWHLPTASPALTGQELVQIAASHIGTTPKLSVLSPLMIRMAGIFNRTIYEVKELLYQNTEEYVFDSSRFEKTFQFQPTGYHEGIKETVQFEKARLMIESS